MVNQYGIIEEKRMLNYRLVFGAYPDVVLANGNEIKILKELTDSYLYKDILMYDGIKNANKLEKLLKALALQIGNEVSYNELGNTIQMNNETV